MKYISKYNNIDEFTLDLSKLSKEEHVAWISDESEYGKIIYIDDDELCAYDENGEIEVDLTDYLCFTASGENSTISLHNEYSNAPKIYYSFDKENWTKWDYSSISLADGQSVYMYGDNPKGFSHWDDSEEISDVVYSNFVMSGIIKLSGNILSLISKKCPNIIPNDYCFFNLFVYNNSILTAPKLPATILTKCCYNQMFYDCTSLVEAPELPATALASSCYFSMFSGCSSLTTAPELPATTLVDSCYNRMFLSCSNLNYVKCYATTNINTTNLINWLANTSTSGDFYKDSTATYPSGESGIPSGWTLHNME